MRANQRRRATAHRRSVLGRANGTPRVDHGVAPRGEAVQLRKDMFQGHHKPFEGGFRDPRKLCVLEAPTRSSNSGAVISKKCQGRREFSSVPLHGGVLDPGRLVLIQEARPAVVTLHRPVVSTSLSMEPAALFAKPKGKHRDVGSSSSALEMETCPSSCWPRSTSCPVARGNAVRGRRHTPPRLVQYENGLDSRPG